MALTTESMGSDPSLVSAMMELGCAGQERWESTLEHVLRIEANALDVERVSFWIVSDEPSGLVCEMAYNRTSQAFERGYTVALQQDDPFLSALRRSSPLVVEDVPGDRRLDSLRGFLEGRAISSVLDIPVWVEGRVACVIADEQVGRPRHWSISDQSFAAAMAQTVAVAFQRRALAEAQRRVHRTAFLDRTSRRLFGTFEVQEVGLRAAALAVPFLAQGAIIDLVEGDDVRRLALHHATEHGRAVLERVIPTRLSGRERTEFLVGRTIAGRASMAIPDLYDDALVREAELHPRARELIDALRELGVRSLAATPLWVGDRVIGTIHCLASDRRYDIADVGLLEEFALRVAAAIENARLYSQARGAVSVRDEFIALAGHELRTPLTALKLNVQDLVRRLRTAPPERMEQRATGILKEVRRLDRLTTRMLDATRIATSTLPLSREETDLVRVVRDVSESMEGLMRGAGCVLTVHAGEAVLGDWDPVELEEAILNLLDNAAKFGAGHPVEVVVRREGQEALLAVRDHGPGIAPDRIRLIFAEFERAVPLHHYGGLGLGLYVSRAIAEAHGGKLEVNSRPGEGATFILRLPLKERSSAR